MSTDPGFGAVIPQFTLGDRLRKARETTGLDQSAFAAEIGVSRSSVSNWEAGAVSRVKPIVLRAWALRTRVPLEWLETGKTPTPDGPGGGVELLRLDLNQRPSDYQQALVTAA